MKIICSSCKKTIGEKAPFKDSSEIKAKCPDCISKEREAITPFQPVPRPEDGQTVIIDTNLTGTLWVPKNQNEKISLWELGVSGKKFFCSDANKEQFQEYLESIRDEQCDVSFLHSLTCTLDKPPKRGKKKEAQSTTENKKDDSIQYNCTVKVNKQYALSMFNGMAERFKNVLEILIQAAQKDKASTRSIGTEQRSQ